MNRSNIVGYLEKIERDKVRESYEDFGRIRSQIIFYFAQQNHLFLDSYEKLIHSENWKIGLRENESIVWCLQLYESTTTAWVTVS